MKNGPIFAGIAGGICFAVPFWIGLGVPVSVGAGLLGLGAGALVFSDDKSSSKDDGKEESFNDKISRAKKLNSDLINMINKVEDNDLKTDIRSIYQTADKIINTVSKNPKKIKYVESFFDYYLPETLKLLYRYDEIENQRLGKSGDDFMKKMRDMVSKLKDAFNEQLVHLYKEDMVNTSADMKVLDSMMKSEGFGENDFKQIGK